MSLLPVMQVGLDYILLLLLLAIPFLIAYFVFSDAIDRGNSHPWAWGISVFVLLLLGIIPGVVVIALYIVVR